MSAPNFFEELKRRSVYKVGAAYAVVGWLVIQVATIVFPAFNAPPWVLKVVISLIALRFVIAVALAWAFEITPEGIKRSEDVEPHHRGASPRKGRKLAIITVIGAILVVALLVFGTGGLRSFVNNLRGGAFAIGKAEGKSIAVLPFENVGGDAEDAFFADGIQDDLLTSPRASRS